MTEGARIMRTLLNAVAIGLALAGGYYSSIWSYRGTRTMFGPIPGEAVVVGLCLLGALTSVMLVPEPAESYREKFMRLFVKPLAVVWLMFCTWFEFQGATSTRATGAQWLQVTLLVSCSVVFCLVVIFEPAKAVAKPPCGRKEPCDKCREHGCGHDCPGHGK